MSLAGSFSSHLAPPLPLTAGEFPPLAGFISLSRQLPCLVLELHKYPSLIGFISHADDTLCARQFVSGPPCSPDLFPCPDNTLDFLSMLDRT
jgi:hypothetical protein